MTEPVGVRAPQIPTTATAIETPVVARRQDHSVENAHHAEMVIDGGLAVIESSHAWHAFGAASGAAIAGVAVLGLAAGLVIYDAADEVRQRDIAIGRQLGL